MFLGISYVFPLSGSNKAMTFILSSLCCASSSNIVHVLLVVWCMKIITSILSIYIIKTLLLNIDYPCLPRCCTFGIFIAIVAIVVGIYLSAHFIAIVTWCTTTYYFLVEYKLINGLHDYKIYNNTTKELPEHSWSLFSHYSSVSFVANWK